MRPALLLSLLLLVAAPAQALQIDAQLTDLDDGLGPGGDYWEAGFTVSGHAFAALQGFRVLFDEGLYADLLDPTPVAPLGWDELLVQPIPVLAAEGAYDALVVSVPPQLGEAFRVRFVWLGAGAPGSQPWELARFEQNGTLAQVLARGDTIVPEPHLLLLLLPGLGLAARRSP